MLSNRHVAFSVARTKRRTKKTLHYPLGWFSSLSKKQLQLSSTTWSKPNFFEDSLSLCVYIYIHTCACIYKNICTNTYIHNQNASERATKANVTLFYAYLIRWQFSVDLTRAEMSSVNNLIHHGWQTQQQFWWEHFSHKRMPSSTPDSSWAIFTKNSSILM